MAASREEVNTLALEQVEQHEEIDPAISAANDLIRNLCEEEEAPSLFMQYDFSNFFLNSFLLLGKVARLIT